MPRWSALGLLPGLLQRATQAQRVGVNEMGLQGGAARAKKRTTKRVTETWVFFLSSAIAKRNESRESAEVGGPGCVGQARKKPCKGLEREICGWRAGGAVEGEISPDARRPIDGTLV